MEIYLRFLLLFVCIVVLQPDGNMVASDASQNLEQTQYTMLKEQVEAMNKQITRFTGKFDNTIEEQNRKIWDVNEDIQRLHPDNSPIGVTPTTPTTPDYVVGTTFVRWGRKECPSKTSVPVYIGYVGGSHYKHSGGAAEYVCLPPDPQWNTNKHFNGPDWGYMYGAEYDDISNLKVKYLDVPCAVCLAKKYSTTIMIAGRMQCYPGWQEAYHGELASGRHVHSAPSEYVCLDNNYRGIGSKTEKNGKLFYPVRAKCGSLPCPPYEDNKLLTCVVCLGG